MSDARNSDRPAAVVRPRRTARPLRERGTVLLMVVGVLALLSIIAVVYASIGQADRRASVAYVRGVNIDDQAAAIGDYISSIIARDTRSTFTEQEAVHAAEPAGRVGPTLPPSIGNRLIRKTWNYPYVNPHEVSLVPTSGSPMGDILFKTSGGLADPWLAPVEPSWIDLGNQPYDNNAHPIDRPYVLAQDWRSISNIFPNGRFVNLASLRNNFTAEPGVGLDAQGNQRMSAGLTLFGQTGLPYRSTGPGAIVRRPDGTAADPNRPADWTMTQIHAFRPIRDIQRITTGNPPYQPNMQPPGPGANEYLWNQWADADGDGMTDSRWGELVDDSHVQFGADKHIHSILPQNGQARIFAAVRIVDLSSMVNVNSASDLVHAPTNDRLTNPPDIHPLGFGPGDIDLHSLLTMRDAYSRFRYMGQPVGYNLLENPVGTSVENYSQYTGVNAVLVGDAAYEGLYQSLKSGVPPRGSIALSSYVYPSARERAGLYNTFGSDPGGASNTPYPPPAPGPPPPVRSFARAAFGMPEESELRVYWTANDSNRTSRLEGLLDGRSDQSALAGFGPLRSNRDFSIERGGKGNAAVAPVTLPHTKGDGLPDDDAMLQTFSDRRHLLTTVSSSRPLTSIVSAAARAAIAGGSHDLVAPFIVNGAVPRNDNGELRVNLRDRLIAPAGATQQQRQDLARDMSLSLFTDMADCLMPYRDTALWDMTIPQNRCLFYGHDSELAYHMLLHSWANTMDAIDDDDDVNADIAGPTMVSARIFEAPAPPDVQFPFRQVSLPAAEMPPPGVAPAPGHPRAVNIIGIEAQPVLIETMVGTWYVDTPHDATNPGDDEFQPPPGPHNITINGDINPANADFLGQVIAFQLTNPFDRDIILTQGDGKLLYYIEFAGNFYQLAREDDSGGGSRIAFEEVRLHANETKVFYATSPQSLTNIEPRFVNAGSSPSHPAVVPLNPGFIEKFADAQFRNTPGPNGKPVHIPMIADPRQGMIAPAPQNLDIQGAVNGSTVAQRKVVNLWRVVHAATDPAGGPNFPGNDVLVDRLHDPEVAGEVLTRRLTAGNVEVPGTVAGDEGSADPQDNTGFCLTIWGAIRRPTNANPPATRSPRGIMPPWCIETKLDNAYTGIGGALLLNSTDKERGNFAPGGGRGDGTQYGITGQSRYRNVQKMVQDQLTVTPPGGDSVDTQLRKKAEEKTGNQIDPNANQSKDLRGIARTFESQGVEIRLAGKDRDGVVRNPGLFTRTGDVLLPLAIGPEQDPRATTVEDQWLTLSEVLALSMDYYSPQTGNLFYQFGHSDDSKAIVLKPKADRGNFVLDDYAPFYDVNGDGFWEPGAGAPARAGLPAGPGGQPEQPGDFSLGLGIPLALNLLDKFRIYDRTFIDFHDGLTKGTSGLVNINTASRAVASAIPLLFPDAAMVGRPGGPPMPWMTNRGTVDPDAPLSPPMALFDPARQSFDIATTVVAYRDKCKLPARLIGAVSPPQTISFQSTPSTSGRVRPDGRYMHAAIPGLHESAGFRSVGEIMAANIRQTAANLNFGAPLPATDPLFTNSIDHLGNDGNAILGYPGIDTSTFHNPNLGGTDLHDQATDDYAEKIAIATAALGTISVRSDTFCVYFLVRGYLPSDVEVGTDTNTPMVPSIQRRYMMVIDRSNVTRAGDKPRVLLFQEVPL